MCKYRLKQHLIVLKLDSVSINKILVTKYVTVKVSYIESKSDAKFVNTVKKTQLNRYEFLKLIECLEQNIRKQIDCKRPSNTKQMNWVQNIQIKMGNYKAVTCFQSF